MGTKILAEQSLHGNLEHKYVMVIDLAKCKNARKCVENCQKAHHLPPHQELMKVYLMQENEEAVPYWMPKPCFHCEHPLCADACPEGATIKSADGIVLINRELCKNCKLCLTVCPYSSRLFNRTDHLSANAYPDASDNKRADNGTGIRKCDFCAQLVHAGAMPICVTSCPSGVIYFGDQLEDSVSNGAEAIRFSELIASRSGFRYLEELGTSPSVFYLPTSEIPRQ
jgi:molybdopterin-containing oxidoreductase family iron-sulfur binding subunit